MMTLIRIKTLKRLLKGRSEDMRDAFYFSNQLESILDRAQRVIKEKNELSEKYSALMDRYLRLSEFVDKGEIK